MAKELTVAQTVAAGMLNSTGLAESIGANGKLRIYSGTKPTNVDTALSGNTLLAELTLAATPFSGFTDGGTYARATFGAITSDSSADATGTATFWRIFASDGTTVKLQGTVDTSNADLVLNTTAITLGSTVAITSGTIDLPKGP